ncbi:DUF58 domain-containing protein [Devriesea agamarum]|uniref:DUF58 domain-containing protein n=1 Tax=Devriesea agamarum TaxID=472569 RepID=UPI00071E4D62|nr:DUF58 domain-containing protein [Devriesea agamarum]
MATSLLTRVRAKIDFHTSYRARGIIQGRGRSLFKGSGEDFDDLRTYQQGDRISDIDWKATARSNEPLIRQFTEQRVRHICLLVDTSSGMSATAADGTVKSNAMLTAAGLICYAASRHGDLVGLVAGHRGAPVTLPARSATAHLERVLQTVQRSTTWSSPPADIAWLLDQARYCISQPSLLVLLTDDAHPHPSDYDRLRKLRFRHDVLTIRVRDADPLQPKSMRRQVTDIDLPRHIPSFARSSLTVQNEVRKWKKRRRQQIDGMLVRLGIDDVLVSGESDVVPAIIKILGRRGRRGRR